MKKQIGFTVIALLVSISFVLAQGPGNNGPKLTIPERIKVVNDKIADFKLSPDKLAQADSVFSNYYTAVQKQRDDMMAAGGTPDRDAMRANMMKLSGARDEQLKQIFTDEQFQKWKNDIEPTLRPQRPNRQ